VLTLDDISAEKAASAGLALAETHLGASPVFTHVWPASDELNAQLRQVVLDRMAVSPGLKKSNCGGWQSERNLQLWGDPSIEELLDRVQIMLRDVIRATVDDPGDSLLNGWDIEAWANVNQLGDTVAAHTHSGGVNMWAAIYYVDTGYSAGAPSSGVTRFMDMSGTPRPMRGRMPVPSSLPAGGGRQDRCTQPEWHDDHDLQLQPHPGKMAVFPASLPHYVTAYEGTGKRITIAFNLRHTKFAVADFENPYSRGRVLWRNFRGLMLIMYNVKRLLRGGLASVVPVQKWPAGLRRRLLGGG
jgi:putative 2-oxoglutarate-Fe(II)-dependent oxygenase superfamily protein